jgi:hypothetical protein
MAVPLRLKVMMIEAASILHGSSQLRPGEIDTIQVMPTGQFRHW